jgi:ethanolamine ammonia-lyase small subunit
LIEKIVMKVIENMKMQNQSQETFESADGREDTFDITSEESKKEILIDGPCDKEALMRMKSKTAARIGVGRAGCRLNTRTLLTLRADHAVARDAVMTDVDEGYLERQKLFSVKTMCRDRNQHLTRPDMGAQFSKEVLDEIKSKCIQRPQVQIFVSDGLSSKAIEANIENILPSLNDGLKRHGINAGTPFFVKYGRVPVMDVVSETIGSDVTCLLIGERPGLATSKSMSAYIAYKATVGMPESRRTVVSNIHDGGINAAEAGAYIADVIKKILELKVCGVDLKL